MVTKDIPLKDGEARKRVKDFPEDALNLYGYVNLTVVPGF